MRKHGVVIWTALILGLVMALILTLLQQWNMAAVALGWSILASLETKR